MKDFLEVIKNNPTFVASVLRVALVSMFAAHTIEEGQVDEVVTAFQAILFVAIEVWNRNQVTPVRKLENVEELPADTSHRKVPIANGMKWGTGPARMEDTREMPGSWALMNDNGDPVPTLNEREAKDYDALRDRAREAPAVPPWLSVARPTKAEDVKLEDTILVLPGATIGEEK